MEAYTKNLPIEELIAQLDAYMVGLGYTSATLRHHRQAWNALKNLAAAEGVTNFSKELGFRLLREHYHVEPYEPKLSEYKSVVRRSVMLLLEYQISGTIAKRTPKREMAFPYGFEEVGREYFALLTEKGLSQGTVYNHCCSLVNATSFFENHGIHSVDQLTTDTINNYLKTLSGYSKSHIRSSINSLQKFLEFAAIKSATKKKFTFPVVSVFNNRRVPEYYSAEEVSRILSAIDRGNALGKRNYAIVLLGARYGLRISDIISLQLGEVDFENNRINIIQKKTRKPLTLDFLPDVGWAVIDYLKYGRPDAQSSAVFLRHVHPYTPLANGEAMQYVIHQYALSAGIWKVGCGKRCSFHMLRYSIASDLIQQGVSLTAISGILGHSELNVTTTYTQLDTAQLKDCALEVMI